MSGQIHVVDAENLFEKNDNSRLKTILDTVLRVSEKKFSYNKKSDSSRIKWGRLIIQSVKVYGELVRNEELEELSKEVEELKAEVRSKWRK